MKCAALSTLVFLALISQAFAVLRPLFPAKPAPPFSGETIVIGVEVPAKPQWCEIRKTVFSWAQTKFPFHTSSAKKLKVDQAPVIRGIGKAYFDVGHAPKDQSNGRKYQPNYAVWEIHPVMKLETL